MLLTFLVYVSFLWSFDERGQLYHRLLSQWSFGSFHVDVTIWLCLKVVLFACMAILMDLSTSLHIHFKTSPFWLRTSFLLCLHVLAHWLNLLEWLKLWTWELLKLQMICLHLVLCLNNVSSFIEIYCVLRVCEACGVCVTGLETGILNWQDSLCIAD